jgi:hypothetical protein
VRFNMKNVLGALLLLVVSALPARAESVTIDSTNCSEADACFGLSWTLTINTGIFLHFGIWEYQAILNVKDDPLVSGTPSITISAVDFKVSSSLLDAVLYKVPASTTLNAWTTSINNLSSGGCVNPANGFACSQSSTDPANFVASNANQTWGWYFNTNAELFDGLDGAHIGAKLVDLQTSGRLLSEEFSVPEPGSLALLALGSVVVGAASRRRERRKNA